MCFKHYMLKRRRNIHRPLRLNRLLYDTQAQIYSYIVAVSVRRCRPNIWRSCDLYNARTHRCDL